MLRKVDISLSTTDLFLIKSSKSIISNDKSKSDYYAPSKHGYSKIAGFEVTRFNKDGEPKSRYPRSKLTGYQEWDSEFFSQQAAEN